MDEVGAGIGLTLFAIFLFWAGNLFGRAGVMQDCRDYGASKALSGHITCELVDEGKK